MKRLFVTIVVVSSFFSGLLVINAEAAVSCNSPDTPGCTNGLPTDTYNALKAQMTAHPSPEVTAAPIDKQEIWNYSGFWRVIDNAPFYDQPNGNVIGTAVPGFNFVAIHAISGDFAQLKDKKWVRRSDLKQSYASAYSGVMFDNPLPFPIAWVIQASIPASTPGGSRNIKTPAISRYTLVYIYATVKVDQWDWYLVGPGQWLPQQKVARVVPATRPKDATDKWVSVDLFEKVLTAYEGDKLVFATLVSPGLPQWQTNVGVFKVWKRLTTAPMSGAMGQPDFYSLPAVPYVMYFDNDISLHGTYWHDGYGFNHSHGCVNLSISDAHWIFNWIGNGDLTVQVMKSA